MIDLFQRHEYRCNIAVMNRTACFYIQIESGTLLYGGIIKGQKGGDIFYKF